MRVPTGLSSVNVTETEDALTHRHREFALVGSVIPGSVILFQAARADSWGPYRWALLLLVASAIYYDRWSVTIRADGITRVRAFTSTSWRWNRMEGLGIIRRRRRGYELWMGLYGRRPVLLGRFRRSGRVTALLRVAHEKGLVPDEVLLHGPQDVEGVPARRWDELTDDLYDLTGSDPAVFSWHRDEHPS